MANKRYVEKFLEKVIPLGFDLDLYFFKRKKLSHTSNLFKLYYWGVILCLLITAILVWIGDLATVYKIIYSVFVGIIIIALFEIYRVIKDNRKNVDLDDYVVKGAVLSKRKNNPKNLNLKFSKTDTITIYNYLESIEFIKRKTTSQGAFDAVLRNDFGHNQNIVLYLNLSQIRAVFDVFEKYSNNFTSLALRKKIFLDEDLKGINPRSYRNTASQNNKKASDLIFQQQISKLDDIVSIIYKNK